MPQLVLDQDLHLESKDQAADPRGLLFCLRCWYKKHHTLQDYVSLLLNRAAVFFMYKTTTDKKRTRKSHSEAANKLLAFSCQTLAWRLDCTTLEYNHHRTRRTIAASKERVYSKKNNALKSELHYGIPFSLFFCTNCCVSLQT